MPKLSLAEFSCELLEERVLLTIEEILTKIPSVGTQPDTSPSGNRQNHGTHPRPCSHVSHNETARKLLEMYKRI